MSGTASCPMVFWVACLAALSSPEVGQADGQRPGDCNQDGAIDISDATCIFGHLFLGRPSRLPCGSGSSTDAGNVRLLDFTTDGRLDISDGIFLLRHLFSGGPPHPLGSGCVEISGCPDRCGAPPVELTAPERHSPSGSSSRGSVTWEQPELDTSFLVDYEIIDGDAVAEGDMVLGRHDDFSQSTPGGLSARVGSQHFWPNGRVPYRIDEFDLFNTWGDEAEAMIDRIERAIAHWELHTPLRFIRRGAEDNYVVFAASPYCAAGEFCCSADVGRQGGKQHIYLSNQCGFGSIVHEIGHCIGLWHEQSRCDRNEYIEVFYDNIDRVDDDEGYWRSQFSARCLDGVAIGPYDYGSVMHYGETLCVEGVCITAFRPRRPVPAGITIGQRSGLSEGDIAGIQTLYARFLELQRNPAVAASSTGSFIAVWEDDQDDNGSFQIRAQELGADGAPRGVPFTVNSSSTGQQLDPAVASNGAGVVVVAWENDSNSDGQSEIFARVVTPRGSERVRQFLVNQNPFGQQRNPAVAMDPAGNFVVVWEDDADGNHLYQIKGHGFHANGDERIPTFTVNTVSDGQQLRPAIAMDARGNFVVVWDDDADGNFRYQIRAHGFHATGAQRIPTFTVNSVADGQQFRPAVAMDEQGRFVVAWEDDSDGNGSYQIKARGFSVSGSESIAQFTVNTVATGQQRRPAIAMEPGGDFVVTWEDSRRTLLGFLPLSEVYSRGFDASGREVLREFRVHGASVLPQRAPAIAADPRGLFLAAWQDSQDRVLGLRTFSTP